MNQRSEKWWEKKLGVSTSGKTDNYIEESCNPYEPTEYCILERLAQSGYITSDNHFLDYGCGLGRSLFFIRYQFLLRDVILGRSTSERIAFKRCVGAPSFFGCVSVGLI